MPVPEQTRQTILAGYDQILANTGGKRRAGQLTMMSGIAKTICHAVGGDKHIPSGLIMQAPTGTGKTLSYLMSAIPVCKERKLKVIVGTATVGLQSQIADGDMPQVQKVYPDVTFAVVKGRSRYACVKKAEEVAMFMTLEIDTNVAAQVGSLYDQLAAGKWCGDLDQLPQDPAPEVKAWLTTDRYACEGKRCEKYNSCPYYLERAKAEKADVLIANHDIILANAKSGDNILPKLNECVVVLDEAHQFAEKALRSLEASHAIKEAMTWARKVGKLGRRAIEMDDGGDLAEAGRSVEERCEALADSLLFARTVVEGILPQEAQQRPEPTAFKDGKLPPEMEATAETCHKAAMGAAVSLQKLVDLTLKVDILKGQEAKKKLLQDSGKALTKAEQIMELWGLMTISEVASAPIAKWVQAVRDRHGSADIEVCAGPCGVSSYLAEKIWKKARAVLMLSATVGEYKAFAAESGMSLLESCDYIEVPPAFDYKQQAKLVIPRMQWGPKDVANHTQEMMDSLVPMLEQLPQGDGALLLFPAWGQMKRVIEMMPEHLKQYMLSQGMGLSTNELLAQHKQAIQAGRKSILLGTASLEEGVDLPGRFCKLVSIAKLPFPVPTHPVDVARREWVEGQGGNYFADVAVPQALKRLAQSAGRLIRRIDDSGVIVVWDKRLAETRYGQRMIDSLPPYDVCRQIPALA